MQSHIKYSNTNQDTLLKRQPDKENNKTQKTKLLKPKKHQRAKPKHTQKGNNKLNQPC